jgi:hypothetical protein
MTLSQFALRLYERFTYDHDQRLRAIQGLQHPVRRKCSRAMTLSGIESNCARYNARGWRVEEPRAPTSQIKYGVWKRSIDERVRYRTDSIGISCQSHGLSRT